MDRVSTFIELLCKGASYFEWYLLFLLFPSLTFITAINIDNRKLMREKLTQTRT